MTERKAGWVYLVPLPDEVGLLELISNYVRLPEDVPMYLMALDELQIMSALEVICSNLTKGKPKGHLEKVILLEINNAVHKGQLDLSNYVIGLISDPRPAAILKLRE
jgi:hypothetical protein